MPMKNKRAKETSLEDVLTEAKKFGASPEQARLVHSLIKKHHFPHTVRTFQVKFGQDSTSSPAMWIVFLVDEDLKPSSEKISELNKFADEVRSELLRENLTFWPYVEFRAVS
jgi:hypothetical protein